MLVIAGLVVLIFSIQFYFYTDIPSQFGGGKPRDVVFVLSNEAGPKVSQAGLTVCSGESRTAPTALLYQSDTTFVVRVKPEGTTKGRLVIIDKALVVASITRGAPGC